LWGLPDRIVETAAWHHHPAEAKPEAFGSLIAVHAANYFDHQIHSYPAAAGDAALDGGLLASLGLTGRLAEWAATCQDLVTKGENHE
jgi:hypothetical protein